MLRYVLSLNHTGQITSSNFKNCKHNKLLTWTTSMMLYEAAFALSSVGKYMNLTYSSNSYSLSCFHVPCSLLSTEQAEVGKWRASLNRHSNNSASKVLIQKVFRTIWVIIKILKMCLFSLICIHIQKKWVTVQLFVLKSIYFMSICLHVCMLTMCMPGAREGRR